MDWQKLPFSDVFDDVTGGNIKTKSGDYLPMGTVPIVDQGKELISGYSNDEQVICKTSLPIIIFGDHTRIIKYVDFPFGLGADGVKVLKPRFEADTKYLYYFLQSLYIPNTGYNRHYKYLKESFVLLPPLAEQKRIARILDVAAALQAQRRATLTHLDTLLQSTFLHMFGDPVTNPMHWETLLIEDVILDGPQNGLYRPSTDYGTGTPIIRIDSFYKGKVVGLERLKRVRLEPETQTKYRVLEGEILINRVNSREYLGKSAIVPPLSEPTVFESNMMRFAVDTNRILPQFLVSQMQHDYIKMQIMNRCKDAVNQSSINQGDVKSFELRIPPIDQQEQFVYALGKIEAMQRKILRNVEQVNNLFQSLQQRAFRGELSPSP